MRMFRGVPIGIDLHRSESKKTTNDDAGTQVHCGVPDDDTRQDGKGEVGCRVEH